jgi:flagellar biosynthesis protein FliR
MNGVVGLIQSITTDLLGLSGVFEVLGLGGHLYLYVLYASSFQFWPQEIAFLFERCISFFTGSFGLVLLVRIMT